MNILIAKANEPLINEFDKNIKFTENTKNTSVFKCSKKKQQELWMWLRLNGYNPAAVITF